MIDFIRLLRRSALKQQKSHGPLRLVLNQGKQVTRPNCSRLPEVVMNSLNLSTAEANKFLTDTRPSGVQSRMCSKDAERRFSKVVLPYLADAHALARWLTGNHADSQDVVQDACLRALHGIGDFADGDARSWVLTIVRRTAYDWLKRNRPGAVVRGQDLEALERTHLPETDAGSPERSLIDREEESLFENAVAELPTHYRQTLALRHVRGFTYREIAESTGISISTVMSRLSRARRHLITRMSNKNRNQSRPTSMSRSGPLAKCSSQRVVGRTAVY
jgi:RNA polymerase sigma factor (sigma-70 family)